MTKADPSPFDEKLVAATAPPGWQNPRAGGRYNLVVVGAGPAGLVCAAGAAGLGARVALLEKHRLGGDCLHFGCVPSKALLRCARAAADVRRAADYGVRLSEAPLVDFPAVMNRLRRLRADIGEHDAAERFRTLGVDVFFGAPRFTGPDTIEIAGQTLAFARAVVATGARATSLGIAGLDQTGYLTNETVFDLNELPPRLVIVGAGPIGCELAQAFRRFGSAVHMLDVLPMVLSKDEPEARTLIQRCLESEGVHLHLGVRSIGAELHGTEKSFVIEEGGQRVRLPFDAILVAVGRKANVEDLGLEAAGIQYTPAGIQVNDFLQTTNSRIYAAGDVCSPFKFTHAADAMARIVLRNALFFGRARASKLVIPWCTYTDPEVAHVGLTAEDAQKQGLAIQTFRIGMDEVDRAVLDGETEGFATVHVRQRTDQIFGATIVACHAGDIISVVTLAMTERRGLSSLSRIIHPYPTQAEVLRKLGDSYQRSRLTPRTAGLLRWLLRWRR
jgi:pyruvate/2-oxoglutarate dehydrogenase complex dihydrolipoamide dehydrogenase (E3) component